jgi:hypothetical protein
MRLVAIESPYAGDVERNERYARAALAHSLSLGEAPFASHLLYTQPGVLKDDVPEEREQGIDAGLEWAVRADARVVYYDLGVSEGMAAGVLHAVEHNQPVEFRRLPGWAG